MEPSLPARIQPDRLPVDAVAKQVRDTLCAGHNLVLIAPPGAGKTTRLPLALLNEPWLQGQTILLVEPRRLPALAAARRMAGSLGQPVGQSIGHRVRLDTRVGPQTRLEVITDGVFTRMIQSDPALGGVGLVLFDEVHERALAVDLGLALALESQSVLRPDLRLVAMSATLDGAAFQKLLGQNRPCMRIESQGTLHPVETLYWPSDRAPLDACIEAVCRAVEVLAGDGLVFLPGEREINAALRVLPALLGSGFAAHGLYGAASRAAQEAALAADPQGRRKLVIASSIAQTSLTIPGVRFVIDSGLARRPAYDPLRAMTRLTTGLASRATIDQRRGRAGREAPGTCIRLWRAQEEGARPVSDRPEMLDADLAALRLDMALWGALSPDALAFLDPPPNGAWQAAGQRLQQLGALDAQGAPTPLARRMASLPLHPRLSAMLERAGPQDRQAAAWAAVLAGELAGPGASDGEERLRAALADPAQARRLNILHRRLLDESNSAPATGHAIPAAGQMVRHLLHAYPDRIAQRQRQDGAGTTYKLAQGMQARLDSLHALARRPYLLVLDLGGAKPPTGSTGLPNIRLALALDEGLLRWECAAQITRQQSETFDPASWSVRVRAVENLGALKIGEANLPRKQGLDALPAIQAHLLADGWASLVADGSGAQAVLDRHQAFHEAQGAPDGLMEGMDIWLPALLGQSPQPPFEARKLNEALLGALNFAQQKAFQALFPSAVALPNGRMASIDYAHPAGPAISVRPQWLYGLDSHAMLSAAGATVLIELLSPASRPIALTGDLPAFWRGSWADVRKDMRARYPKHDWPEEPWKAQPSMPAQRR